MNQRNVDALASIIGTLGAVPRHDSWARHVAGRLAAAGVLVPSALTDEQAKAAADEGSMQTSDYDVEYRPEDLRTALTNIAKAGTARLPWAIPAGERLRGGDNVALDPATGKLVRWRNGLTHFCYARKDVAEGETLTSDEAFSC